MPDNYIYLNKNAYDSLAKEYEQKVTKRSQFNAKVIDKFISFIKTGPAVLDLGCAVGLDMQIFSQKGFQTTGLEISPKMAAFAKKRSPESEIIIGNFLETDLNRQFDAIFAQAFIHLFPKSEVGLVFQKIYSLLKTGGVAHITSSKSKVSREGFYSKVDYQGEQKRFRKFWTKRELKQSLMENNFKIIDYYEITDPYQKTWMVFTVEK